MNKVLGFYLRDDSVSMLSIDIDRRCSLPENSILIKTVFKSTVIISIRIGLYADVPYIYIVRQYCVGNRSMFVYWCDI